MWARTQESLWIDSWQSLGEKQKSHRDFTQMSLREFLNFARSVFFTLILFGVLQKSIFYFQFVLQTSTSCPMEVLRVFLHSLRFDLSVASGITLLALVLGLPMAIWLRKCSFLFRTLRAFLLILVGVVALFASIHHFYFYYYKDNFNVYLWEFFKSKENTALVLASLPDEIPLWAFVAHFVTLFGAAFAIHRVTPSFFRKVDEFFVPKIRTKLQFALATFGLVAVLVLGARGTLDLPLPKQNVRGMISADPLLSKMHTNAFYAFLNALELAESANITLFGTSAQASRRTISREEQNSLAQKYQSWVTDGMVVTDGSCVLPARKVTGRRDTLFAKPPKHVVLILMESFVMWPMEVPDDGFSESVSPYFPKTALKGLFFENVFQEGTGTFSNLMRSIHQVPTSIGYPAEYADPSTFRVFPTSLPALMKSKGFESHFHYAGSLAWHGLDSWLPKFGIDFLHSEAALPKERKGRFGIWDEDLFEQLLNTLNKSTNPSFHIALTLSNHAPFRLPPWRTQSEINIKVPSSLAPFMRDSENFHGRYNLLRYADWALDNFLKNALETEAGRDTLFVMMADHANDGPFQFEIKEKFLRKRIPLLFYAPYLLRSKGERKLGFGSHVDLGATLIDLLSTGPEVVPSFGRSYFDDPDENRGLHSFHINCKRDVCVSEFATYHRNEQLLLTPCSTPHCKNLGNEIMAIRKVRDELGESYLLGACGRPKGK
jgi:phosphoglycerol transferase MdoB-like AlkP superfamily enzyme